MQQSLLTNKSAATMGIEEFLLTRAENKGRKEATEETKLAFVNSLLDNTDFSNERIAAIASVTIAFVENVRAARK